MKRIILLVTVVAVMAAIAAASALSGTAQDYTSMSQPTGYCAPWSKEWNISGGWWYFDWYRWCYDPAVGEVWYKEWGAREWLEPANLCPESGTCRVSVG